MRIALIGVSGSGKGTQAKLLAERYRVSHISTGDLLREEARDGKRLSEQDRKALDEGRLVDDDVVRELLEERLRRKDTKRGFVIDGYPRNIPQAQSLDNLLGMLGRPLQIAIYTEMSDDLLNKRNVGRQTCTSCGEIYNRYFSPPTEADICDKCGAPLGTRKDDTPKAVAARVAIHKENTLPLITYFRAQHKLRTVAAAGTVEEIHDKISAIVDLEIRPLEIEAVFSAAESSGEEDNTVIAGGQINRIPVSAAAARKPARAAAKPAPTANRAAKKVSSKKTTTTAKKAAAKKAATRKTTASKASAKKTTVKKAATGKVAAKKVAPKKAAVKKTVAKKTAAKKKTTKKAVAKKAPTKKATVKKSPAKKKVAKKAPVRKAASKKTPKQATGKATTKKPSRKSTTSKVPAKKKAVAKKPAAGAKKKKPASRKK